MNSIKPISWLADSQDAVVVAVFNDPQLLEGKGQVELGPVDPLVVVGVAPGEVLVHGYAHGKGRKLEGVFCLRIKRKTQKLLHAMKLGILLEL